ncbi:APC family permease [Phytohabitans rumicis]|uniref:Amino acid permease n=1 Tax=Phytohabitans rumicis TaxID=1076125 RepID=A0A6V8L8H1_9ACTN|nr:APC family permease [Phytohabitans rumicis]GFJ90297.1 amino acid permease [Phytohabitans rumicis]
MVLTDPVRPRRVSNVSTALARNRLGVPAVVFFVMAAAAPLTVVAGSATTGFAVTEFIGIAVAYLAVAVILAVFAVGYIAMSRRVVNAGAFYTYVAHGLGRIPGVGAAFVAVVAYNAMQISIYGAFGVVAAAVLEATCGWQVAWWVCALAAWLLVAVLGVRRVDLNGYVLGVLLVAEIAVAVVFDVVLLTHPADGQVSFAALAPGLLLSAGAVALLVGGIAGFAGFEMTAVFSEEARDPQRTVPRATYLAIGIIGVLYGLSAWAMTVATGPDRIVQAAQEQGTELFFNLAAPHVPAAVIDVGHLLFLTSLFAALLAFHNTVSRYLFALGREQVLPGRLGRTSRRTGAPKLGSFLQSVTAVAVLILYAAAGWDPITHLFFWGGIGGGLGILILMAATSIAVVGFFARHRHGEPVLRRLIAPILAALILTATLVVTVAEFAELLNIPNSSPVRWAFPAAYATAAVLGVGWALILRTARRSVYAAIGLGADSSTAAIRLSPTGVAQPDLTLDPAFTKASPR